MSGSTARVSLIAALATASVITGIALWNQSLFSVHGGNTFLFLVSLPAQAVQASVDPFTSKATIMLVLWGTTTLVFCPLCFALVFVGRGFLKLRSHDHAA